MRYHINEGVMAVLKKVVVVSNTSFSDVEYLVKFDEHQILDGLNAIEVNQIELAKKVAGFLKFNDHFDIFIISKDKNVLNQIYKLYPYARLIYEVPHLYDFNKLKSEIFGVHSYTVLVSDSDINQQTVRQLKKNGIVVFTRVNNSLDIARSMLAGVDGVVGLDINELPLINADYGLSPFVIAHRGFHDDTQENSIMAARKAHQMDADFIEMDIHMTKDNKIVVNHDHTLGRTYEKDFVIKKEKLKALQKVKMTYKDEMLDERLPLLKDFDTKLVESNIGFIVESKVDSKFAMKKLSKVISTMNRPILLMSFHPFAIIHMKRYMPNLLNGLLIDFNVNKMSLKSLIKTSNKYQMMIHPYYKHNKPEYTEELKRRAINILPWGVADKDAVVTFLRGCYGVNTNHIDELSEVVKFVTTKREVTYQIGDTFRFDLKSDKLFDIDKEAYIYMDEDTGIIVEKDQIIQANKPGVAYIYLVAKIKLGSTRYKLASDLIKVNVKEKELDFHI